jgi:hypothetical protein
MVRMSRLYETVHAVLARGPRCTEEIITECRRAGQSCRPETITLFLHLSHETVDRDGTWSRKAGSKNDRILTALQKAFASGQAYVPMDRLSRFLDEGEPITGDDIASACKECGQYRVQGTLILRVQ